MSDKFNVRWEADDGYAGGARPHNTQLHASDIEEDMSNDDLEDYICDAVGDDFRERVSFSIDNMDEVLKWAKSIRDAKAKETAE